MTTDNPAGWAALADTISDAKALETLVTQRAFTRDEIRTASDALAASLADWLESLNSDPDDRRLTHGPMLTRDQVTALRGFLADRWKKAR